VRRLALLLVLAVVLAGCASQEQIQEPEPVILEGSRLADVGLKLDIEALKPLDYPCDYELELNYFLVHESLWLYDPTMDILAFDYPDLESLSIEVVPALYLQGFRKSADPDAEQLFKVGSDLYKAEELEKYKLFEDEDVLVFDITDLLFDEEFSARFDWVDEWGLEVYEYLRSHEDVVIGYLEER